MMRLLAHLPDALAIDGQSYPVYTDFRHWMAFELMLTDTEIGEKELPLMMLSWFRETPPENISRAVYALLWFYRGGQPPETAQGSGTARRIYHFDQDIEMIYASFASGDGYGMDLAETEHLHWWKFRAMLLHISPRTAIGRAMGIRASDDSELSEAQRRLKRVYDLERQGAPLTLAERDEELKKRAREARQRSEAARTCH